MTVASQSAPRIVISASPSRACARIAPRGEAEEEAVLDHARHRPERRREGLGVGDPVRVSVEDEWPPSVTNGVAVPRGAKAEVAGAAAAGDGRLDGASGGAEAEGVDLDGQREGARASPRAWPRPRSRPCAGWHAATIFSRSSAPPPPLIRRRSSSNSSAPSMVRSSSGVLVQGGEADAGGLGRRSGSLRTSARRSTSRPARTRSPRSATKTLAVRAGADARAASRPRRGSTARGRRGVAEIRSAHAASSVRLEEGREGHGVGSGEFARQHGAGGPSTPPLPGERRRSRRPTVRAAPCGGVALGPTRPGAGPAAALSSAAPGSPARCRPPLPSGAGRSRCSSRRSGG